MNAIRNGIISIPQSNRTEQPKAGERWRHYCGDLYTIISISVHTETREPLVIYRLSGAHRDVQAWARPLHMFMEQVEIPDPGDNMLRIIVSRFTRMPPVMPAVTQPITDADLRDMELDIMEHMLADPPIESKVRTAQLLLRLNAAEKKIRHLQETYES